MTDQSLTNRPIEVSPFIDQILQGDALELATLLPDESIDCIVTSPPYFGHRRYTDDVRELGRERAVNDYVSSITKYIDALYRPLKSSGSLWLNLGDTFREKRLLGIPWRVALSLQDAGWYLRTDVIWHKPNAMPSSVKNRPTIDHEYLFFFTKSSKYYYDADAIREPHVTFSAQSRMRGGRAHLGIRGGTPETGKNEGNSNLHDGRWDQYFHPLGRNKRSVWSVPLGKNRDAHFAVFPEALIRPCIEATCPPGGVVLDPFCGVGTTAVVARRHGRFFIGFELEETYIGMAEKRVQAIQPTLT